MRACSIFREPATDGGINVVKTGSIGADHPALFVFQLPDVMLKVGILTNCCVEFSGCIGVQGGKAPEAGIVVACWYCW